MLICASAVAQEPDGAENPIDAMSREHSICAAYDYVAAECLGRLPGGSDLSARYERIARHMYAIGYTLAVEAGHDEQAFTARFNRHLKLVKARIGHSCERVTELAPVYGPSCKRLAEEPELVFEELLGATEPEEAVE